MKILTFDVETTGLPLKWAKTYQVNRWPHIGQFSWMVYDSSKNKVVALEDHIVKLPKGLKMLPDSIKIHGITNEKMRRNGKDINIILKKFMSDVRKSKILVAHNIQFDMNMITVEQIRNGYKKTLKDSRKNLFCTMKEGKNTANLYRFSKFYEKTVLKPPKLIELHQKLFSSIPNNLHNSLIDILVCFRCFSKLYWGIDILSKNSKLFNLYKQYC